MALFLPVGGSEFERKVSAAVNALLRGRNSAGTEFPSDPVLGVRFFRTDRHIEYFWNGDRWLSTELFAGMFPMQSDFVNDFENLTLPYYGVYQIWLEDFNAAYINAVASHVDAHFGSTDSSDNYTDIHVFDGSADTTIGHWFPKSLSIKAPIPTSVLNLQVWFEFISGDRAANEHFGVASVTYRLVG